MEENFSPQQSLQLIESMIKKVRNDISYNRFYFLMWGWFAFFMILSQFFLKVVLNYPHHYLVWILTIPLVMVTMVKSNRQERTAGHRSYISDSMGYLWMGIGISFFVMTVVISATIGWINAWPFFIIFYGMGTFISGMLLKFRPFVTGGIFNWILAIICAFLPYDYQLLTAAAAILTSYIIPAYLLQPSKKQ